MMYISKAKLKTIKTQLSILIILIRGSPGGDSLRAIGVAPSRMTSFQTFRDVDEDATIVSL